MVAQVLWGLLQEMAYQIYAHCIEETASAVVFRLLSTSLSQQSINVAANDVADVRVGRIQSLRTYQVTD